MNKFINWLSKWVPYAWGMMWIFIITGASVGAVIWVTKWILNLMGVL